MFDFTDLEEMLFYQQLREQEEIEREQLKNISYVRQFPLENK